MVPVRRAWPYHKSIHGRNRKPLQQKTVVPSTGVMGKREQIRTLTTNKSRPRASAASAAAAVAPRSPIAAQKTRGSTSAYMRVVVVSATGPRHRPRDDGPAIDRTNRRGMGGKMWPLRTRATVRLVLIVWNGLWRQETRRTRSGNYYGREVADYKSPTSSLIG